MANKNFLDTTGLTYFWNKIADKIANIKPSDIGALTAPATMTANKWLKTDATGAVILMDLPSASTGARGITYLVDSYTRTDTDKAVTPKALNNVYKMLPTGDLLIHTDVSDVEDVTALDAMTLGGHAVSYFAKASDVTTVQNTIKTHASDILALKNSVSALQTTVTDNSTTLDLLSSTVSGHTTSIQSLQQTVSGYDTSISNLQTAVSGYASEFNRLNNQDQTLAEAIQQLGITKLDKAGGEMIGQLIACNDEVYADAQVRNVILSTADPGATDGENGMIWIKYTA